MVSNNSTENLEVFPLFPTLLSTFFLENNPKFEILSDVENKVKFVQRNKYSDYFISENKNILNFYPQLRDRILEIFDDFKNNVLGHTKTDFTITSSWVTKIEHGKNINSYNTHANSYYSGILYISEHDPSLVGKLEVDRRGISVNQISLEIDVDTEYNSNSVYFTPSKNCLMFFPSYLNHRIVNHKCQKSNYFICFNIMPTTLWQETCEMKIIIN